MAGEKAANIEICFLSTLGTMTPFFDSFAEKVVWYSLLWCVVSEIIARNIDAIIVIDSAILTPSMKWDKREWETFQHFFLQLSSVPPYQRYKWKHSWCTYLWKCSPNINMLHIVRTIFGNGFIFRFTRFPHDTHTTSAMWHVVSPPSFQIRKEANKSGETEWS